MVHKEVKLRIEYAIKEGRLTDIQEEYLRKILVLYESGSILNETSKKIKDEISKTMDSFVVYQSVKNNIPETYLINKKENSTRSATCTVPSSILLNFNNDITPDYLS